MTQPSIDSWTKLLEGVRNEACVYEPGWEYTEVLDLMTYLEKNCPYVSKSLALSQIHILYDRDDPARVVGLEIPNFTSFLSTMKKKTSMEDGRVTVSD